MKWLLLAVFVLILLFIPEISQALEVFFSHPFRFALALILGMIFYGWMTFKKEGEELPSFLKLLFFGTNGLFFIAWGVAFFFGKAGWSDALAHGGFLVLGMLVVALLERLYVPFTEKFLSFFTKKAGTERDHLTDVREVAKEAEKKQSAPSFDPKGFFQGAKEDEIFIGLSKDGEPIYVDANQHMEFVGTTGSGKGIMGGVVCTQFAQKGDLVLYMDPKDDEFSPHVLYKAATDAGVTFKNIDLRSKKRQLNIFAGCTPDQFEELLLAGFELRDKGGDSDFYKIGDRKVCYELAQVFKEGDTAEKLYREHKKLMQKAEAFEGKFFELATMTSINAENGISLEEAYEHGGIINLTGSMRNSKVVMVQKMLLVRFIQMAESRDRIKGKPRQIRVVLDELKYHLSRTALEALGAARDKGLSIVMMHQSLGDLRDCPSDLKPESVVDAVFENATLKIVYRVQSPETAEFFARKSGKILVDIETRQVDKTLGLAQKVKERRISQEQSYLYDENEILYLSKGVGIVFGQGLPQKVSIAPIQVTKSYEAVAIQDFGENESVDGAELILED
ncbi:type IV secretory system conjugative DNA transfer family protein [Acinetobacter lwoffii]|jgi:type IV secretory pathway TraG/TraD family ATPase VirD4|uniref:type IV secretory system conjugative DNA transfer family protein n=1 Tax=Acinetobacter lwoffii TaxID=28090 RepID=UPI003F8EB84A